MTVKLPYPPSVKHIYRWTGSRMVMVPRARAYIDEVIILARQKRGTWQPTGPLSMRIDLYPPDRRKRDIDNALSCILDGLAAGVGFDDAQIVSLKVEKHPYHVVRAGGYAWVQVSDSDGASMERDFEQVVARFVQLGAGGAGASGIMNWEGVAPTRGGELQVPKTCCALALDPSVVPRAGLAPAREVGLPT